MSLILGISIAVKEEKTMKKGILTLAVVILLSFMAMISNATNFLEEEAGICAYTNAGRSIDFAKVKPVYRTIEHEVNDYIIGSVPIADYAETEDVHVFVSKDGWVAAYYPAGDPVSKIIDWRSYQGNEITSTNLELALKKVADKVNFPLVNVKYYDFVCPQATNLMMVIDREDKPQGTDSFDIMIPNNLIVYESSWGFYVNAHGIFYIDDNKMSALTTWPGWDFRYGKLTQSQMEQGVFHTIKVQKTSDSGWLAGGIVLVYQKL
jgi:hypothetical protein